jgi:fatty acid desaturase
MSTDPRLRNLKRDLKKIEWRDLLELSPAEKAWELVLSLPWLAASLVCYQTGWIVPGMFCSFYFFLTGLRQSHGAQHYSLGVARRVQDGVLFALSVLMLSSMHAVQASHLQHHRHCLDEDDDEGAAALLPWWKALLTGPLFPLRLHRRAWTLAAPAKRRWIAAEVAGIFGVIGAALAVDLPALRWHVAIMLLGECLTGFFAVWTVHHDCEPDGLFARTQRGKWMTWLTYSMFFHAEHHLFPAVPTCRLAKLAERLDAAAPNVRWPHVMPGVELDALLLVEHPGHNRS